MILPKWRMTNPEMPHECIIHPHTLSTSVCRKVASELCVLSHSSVVCCCASTTLSLYYNLIWVGNISWCCSSISSLDNFTLLPMHFRISLCSPIKSPVRIWFIIALNLYINLGLALHLYVIESSQLSKWCIFPFKFLLWFR